jgi:hypothetical protein
MAELLNTCEDYREAVALGISECARLAGHVQSLRELLRGMIDVAEQERLDAS